MPKISRQFVLCALAYLIAALAALLLQSVPGLALPEPLGGVVRSLPVHVHLLTLGWLTQLIFGIAYWMLPVVSRERGRGSPLPMVVAFVALNVGLPIRVALEPTLLPGPPFGVAHYAMGFSALLLAVAGVAFAVHIVPRVK